MTYPYPGSVYDQIAYATPDLGFWRDTLTQAPGAVLELGVGTGRLALELAPLAHEYHGLDNEPSMLAEAKQKSRLREVSIQLHEGSFLSLDSLPLSRRFDLVLLPANTLSHVVTIPEAERFFSGVRRYCAPRGRFVLDTYNPRPWSRPEEPYEFGRYRDPADDNEVVVWSTPSYNAAQQVATHRLEYRKGAEIVGRHHLEQRSFYPAEITAWLYWAGFTQVTLYGNYDRSDFHAQSPRLIALAV